MAKRNGYSIRMNNSDNAERLYDISCRVEVSESGEVARVNDVTVTRRSDGTGVGNGHFGITGGMDANTYINLSGLTLAETAACLAEVTAFVQQAVTEAVQSAEECEQ